MNENNLFYIDGYSLDKYQIECIKTKLRDKEIPEDQKAILKTRLFYFETKLKKAKKRFSELFFEEYGVW